MDQFEEMRDMAKQVDALGDEPPEINDAEVDAVVPLEADPESAPAPPAEAPAEEATTGGLGSTLETEDDEGLTIDKLLGLDTPSEAKETPKQDDQPPEPDINGFDKAISPEEGGIPVGVHAHDEIIPDERQNDGKCQHIKDAQDIHTPAKTCCIPAVPAPPLQ